MRQAAAGLRQAAAKVLDIRWPLRGAGCGGALVIVACTYFYGRHVGITAVGDWAPAAAAAVFGWLCLLLFAIMVWACVRLARGQSPLELTEPEPPSWRREWIAPVVVVAGILLGWAFFK